MTSTLQPPAVPTFVAGTLGVNMPATMNANVRDPFTFLLTPPTVRLRRTGALTVAENTDQKIAFDTADEDPYGGWSGGDPTKYTVKAPGWYAVQIAASLSGTGAAGLQIAIALAVNGGSHTGVGAAGWEGCVTIPPTGVSTQPKIDTSVYEVYGNVGDYLQVNLWYSTESAITAVDTTAGFECALRAVWTGV